MFVFGVIVIEVWHTQMPVWAYIIALLLGTFSVYYACLQVLMMILAAMSLTVPIGIIQAITSNQLGLNVITELIIGYMVPGRPIAMMQFKVCF